MKTLILAVAMAATVSVGSSANAASLSSPNETGQDQAAIGSEVETGKQAETASPEGSGGFEPEGTVERSGGAGSGVAGLKGESLAEEMATEGQPQEPFGAIDANSDGQLSLSETRAAFEQADRDGNGTVDFGEYRDAMPNIGVGTTELGTTEGEASAGESERGIQADTGQSEQAQEQGNEGLQPGEPVQLSEVDQPGRDSSATDAPFAFVDQDRDGQLSPEEVVGAFRQTDENRDRHVSAQEWQQTMSRFGASSGIGTIDTGSESGEVSDGQGTSERSDSESAAPDGQQERAVTSSPGTVSEQQDDPSAGDPTYRTDEQESTAERSAEEVPTVDPLAGTVPGTGGALESESKAMGDESGTQAGGAAQETPRGDSSEQTRETIVDQQPGDQQLLKPEAERSEEAVEVMSDQAAGEAQPVDQGTVERGATEGQDTQATGQ